MDPSPSTTSESDKKPDKCRRCKLCMVRNVKADHFKSEKHKQNCCLKEYTVNKPQFITNFKKIASVYCEVTSSTASTNSREGTIKVSAKPNETVQFKFTVCNDSKFNTLEVIGIDLVHSELNFEIPYNPYKLGSECHTIPPRTKLPVKIVVNFKSPHIGQYETPIFFNLRQKEDRTDTVLLLREMVVFVEGTVLLHDNILSPYERKPVWAKELIRSPHKEESEEMFPVPKTCKTIYAANLQADPKASEQDKDLASDIRRTMEVGITKENYVKFFHNLLWYEETIIRSNIKNYNMSGVTMQIQPTYNHGITFALTVPGLSEKRPSLMIGDSLFVRPHNQNNVMFEAIIKEITENVTLIGGFHDSFINRYSLTAKYDIRFFLSRISLERMHKAVHDVRNNGHYSRVFPTRNTQHVQINRIVDYFNPLVEGNTEQRCAVERIVAGTSGTAPFLLHGPPGTGKTMTIVEAVLQLAIRPKKKNRILICTDSNMAADHVACMLLKYKHMFSKDQWLLRANSKFRNWETLPESLYKYSNGINRQQYMNVSLDEFLKYSIVITTLSHAAKFGRHMARRRIGYHISHLFIDEAAQASEPACLIPVCALLKQNGSLVLAGDPHQLGPVIISRNAAKIGLGTSLMERLMKTCPLYADNYNNNYVVMLRDNFRSHPDILEIPDKLFYKGKLRACAEADPLTDVDILGEKDTSHGIVFHGVLSKEEKMGKSPSYFNTMECEMVKKYVKRLVEVHNVSPYHIGVVTPYIRQVYQIKKSLEECDIKKVEVGTVEGYQGKEKRVVVISTVRANCNLLDYDAKFQLGFLVDDKRFNVAITRAKAKVIIIGNPLCLEKDIKWCMYMDRCRELGTYHGFDSTVVSEGSGQHIANTLAPLLQSITITVKKPKK